MSEEAKPKKRPPHRRPAPVIATGILVSICGAAIGCLIVLIGLFVAWDWEPSFVWAGARIGAAAALSIFVLGMAYALSEDDDDA